MIYRLEMVAHPGRFVYNNGSHNWGSMSSYKWGELSHSLPGMKMDERLMKHQVVLGMNFKKLLFLFVS